MSKLAQILETSYKQALNWELYKFLKMIILLADFSLHETLSDCLTCLVKIHSDSGKNILNFQVHFNHFIRFGPVNSRRLS